MRTIAVLVGLAMSGCAASHAPCEGPPPDGRYVLHLGGPGEGPGGSCPIEASIYADVSRYFAPLYGCEVVYGELDMCGAAIAVRCPSHKALHVENIPAFVADLDLAWTDDGADGSASITWLDDAGDEVCSGSYKVATFPVR